MAKKQFGEGILSTIFNYIYWFLFSNLYFLLTNILFIYVWLASGYSSVNGINVLLILSAIPIGPSLTALFSTMGKLFRERDINVTRDYFKAYKNNFFESLFIWCILLVFLSIIYLDVLYVNTKPELLYFKYILLFAGFAVASLAFYIFPIISRFYFKPMDVFRLSLYYAVKKFYITILNWIYFGTLIYTYFKVTDKLNIFLWSILAYVIMFNERNVLKEIEEKYSK